MAKSIFWKEKVVRNSFAVVLTLLAALHANAQSQVAKITYTCKSTDLETVINDLSKLTGMSFVYSSDKIITSTSVTFSVKDQPLHEVLATMGKQLNLSFKIQDQHITIKSIGVSFSLVEPAFQHKAQVTSTTEGDKELLATTKPYVPFTSEKMRRAVELPSDNEDDNKYLVKLQPYFNPSFLKNVPVSYVKSTARNMNTHRWFVAAGPIVNSYSTGLEVHAGLQKLYAVLSPSWMANDKFHGAFGLGTTVRFSDALSLKPIYTYASLKESTTTGNLNRIGTEPAYNVNTSISHHQVKLMLQYSISRKFSLRAGPTFNQSKSISKYNPAEITFSEGFTHKPPGGVQYTEPLHSIRINHTLQDPADVTTNKFWIGWEVAFAFRINF